MSNPRHPNFIDPPTMAMRWGNEVGTQHSTMSLPRNLTLLAGRAGALRALHPYKLVLNPVRRAKGSKGHLTQHKTCDMSNAGTGTDSRKGRLADGQCRNRGREAVVAGGVTTTQGYG
jgi:hypothetical protein